MEKRQNAYAAIVGGESKQEAITQPLRLGGSGVGNKHVCSLGHRGAASHRRTEKLERDSLAIQRTNERPARVSSGPEGRVWIGHRATEPGGGGFTLKKFQSKSNLEYRAWTSE
jgi:hypothetical protein